MFFVRFTLNIKHFLCNSLKVFGNFPEWSMEARHAPDALARHKNYPYNKWMNMFDFWQGGHANPK
jgi:hypothetical protein